MKRAQSTHQGSCQACGRVQRLPGGVLAKHGYNVTWGFFNGTCPGSGELPFEKSCMLVARYVANARARLKSNVEFRRALLAPVTGTQGYYHVYFNDSRGHMRGGYRWTKVEYAWLYPRCAGYVHPGTGKLDRTYSTGIYSDVLADYIAHFNRDYAVRDCATGIRELIRYIRWQVKRIETWQEKPLIAIETAHTEVTV